MAIEEKIIRRQMSVRRRVVTSTVGSVADVLQVNVPVLFVFVFFSERGWLKMVSFDMCIFLYLIYAS